VGGIGVAVGGTGVTVGWTISVASDATSAGAVASGAGAPPQAVSDKLSKNRIGIDIPLITLINLFIVLCSFTILCCLVVLILFNKGRI
jgi:hypothetical protein